MVVDDGLIIVQQTVFNIVQPIDIFCWRVNLKDKDRTIEDMQDIVKDSCVCLELESDL